MCGVVDSGDVCGVVDDVCGVCDTCGSGWSER